MSQPQEAPIRDSIRLDQLLTLAGAVQNGAMVIENGEVTVDGRSAHQ